MEREAGTVSWVLVLFLEWRNCTFLALHSARVTRSQGEEVLPAPSWVVFVESLSCKNEMSSSQRCLESGDEEERNSVHFLRKFIHLAYLFACECLGEDKENRTEKGPNN